MRLRKQAQDGRFNELRTSMRGQLMLHTTGKFMLYGSRLKASLRLLTGLVLLMLVSCGRDQQGSSRTSQSFGDAELVRGFVHSEGTGLVLNGAPYRISGANQYYFFYKDRRMVDDVIHAAVDLGLNALRTWAFCEGGLHDGYCFQPQPGMYDEPTMRNLDDTVAKAGQSGLRLILVLANNWGGYDHFGGIDQYLQWSNRAQHDDFYTDGTAKRLYRAYVSYLLNRINTVTGRRYKDDPTILMWELINEPRANDANKLVAWVDEMSAYVKSIDGNHMVSVGSEGEYSNASAFWQIGWLRNIDVVSLHLYPEIWNMSLDNATGYLERHIKAARDYFHKPVYLGEFGLRDQQQRAGVFQRWYQMIKNHGGSGALFWLLSGRQYGPHVNQGSLYRDYDGFTVYNSSIIGDSSIMADSVNRVIRENSRQLTFGR